MCDLLRLVFFRSAVYALSVCSGNVLAALCAFYDHITLKLCECKQHCHYQFSHGRIVCHAHIQNVNVDAALMKVFNDGVSLCGCPCEPVQLCHDEGIPGL